MTDPDTIRLFTLNELCMHRMVEPHDVPWLVHTFGRSEIVKRLGAEYVDRMLLLCKLDGISARNRDMLHAQSHRILREALARYAPSKRARIGVRVYRSPWRNINESDPHGFYDYDYADVALRRDGNIVMLPGSHDPDAVVMEYIGGNFEITGRAYPRRFLGERGIFVVQLRDTIARTRTRPLNGQKVYP